MRLTSILRAPMNYRKLKNESWTRWRRQVVEDDGLAAALAEKGITVEDANEFVKDISPISKEPNPDTMPDPEPLFPKIPENNRTNPDWHDVPCKKFITSSFPVEGVVQAQVFTRSVQIKKGLPQSLLELGQTTKFKDQDQLVESAIKQALLWDTVIEKLPNLRNLEIPMYSFAIKWGLPAKRANEHLVRNLLRVCEMEFPKHATTKVIGGEEEFRVNIMREKYLAQFQLTTTATILSKNLLKPIMANVEETKGHKVPDIFPFNCLANFEKDHVYKESDFLAFNAESPFPNIQTTFFSHNIAGSHTHIHPRWNDDRFSGATVLYCFTSALQMAKRKYGEDVKHLPEPITTQCVHLTGKEFDFAVLQLNTLDLENDRTDDVKNILWLTGKMNLFESCQYTNGKSELIGYNPEVFKNLLAFYGNE